MHALAQPVAKVACDQSDEAQSEEARQQECRVKKVEHRRLEGKVGAQFVGARALEIRRVAPWRPAVGQVPPERDCKSRSRPSRVIVRRDFERVVR